MENIDVGVSFTDKGIEEVIKNTGKLKAAINEGEKSANSLNKQLTQQVSDPYSKVSANLQIMRDKFNVVRSVISEFSGDIDGIKFDKLTEGISKFGLSTEQVVSIGGDFISFLSGTLTPIGLLTSVASILVTTFKDDLIPIISNVVSTINGLIDPVGTANEAFDKQFDLVTNLDTELPSLIKTYNELSVKQNKSKEEQEKLNEATARIAELMPQAVEGVDKYTGSLIINVGKIQAFTDAQKESLKVLSISTLELNKQDLARLEVQKKVQDEILKTGLIQKSVLLPSSTGLGGKIETQSFKLTEIENRQAIATAQQLQEKYIALQQSIQNQQTTIDNINGKKSFAVKENIDLNKQSLESDEKAINKSNELAKKRKDELDRLTKDFDDAFRKIQQQAEKSNITLADNNEQQVLKLQAIENRKIDDLESNINEQAKKLKKDINLNKEFQEIRLASELDFAIKLRKARAQDIETQFGVGSTVTPLAKSNRVVNTSAFKVNENKTLADAIIDPKGFEKKFGEVNKITKEQVDKLNEEIRKLVPKDLNIITDPLEKLKLKILDVLGIDDQQAEAIVNQLSNLANAYLGFFNAKNEASARANEAEAKRIDEELALKDKALDIELQRQKDGSANNVDAVKNEIKALEQERKTALEKAAADREKNQKAQLISDGIVQTSNLITSITDIYKGFAKIPIVGLLLGAAAVGGFLLSIASAKDKARASVKLRDGGLLKGATHENGGIQIADQYEAESGEFVLNKEVTRKNLPFVETFNKGKLSHIDFNSLVGNNAVTDSVQRARASQDLADNYNKSIINEAIVSAIERQTESLISHDKTKVTYIPKKNGYIEIGQNQTGGKRMRHININE